ncbi:MAG: TetR family transcriptional regulator [Betaproteobacteria bacterium]|nr:TetR family transcriptional regulator [Betaproteobacteria bacterium]
MGSSQADKTETHARIVKIAAAKFREAGVDGISVADLMKEAGLTHGGFYRHFASRDELVAEAVEYAMAEALRRLGAAVRRSAGPPFEAMVEGYLSKAHRDADGRTCPLVSLASDVARGPAPLRSSYAKLVNTYIDWIAGLLEAERPDRTRQDAIAALGTMVGALALARSVDDEALSTEILAAARQHLKAMTR